MRSTFRIAMAIAALAASGTAQAQPNANFCADLREIVAAWRETPPFASLPNWSRNGRPMLAFELCGTGSDYGGTGLHFVCTRYDPARIAVSPATTARDDFHVLVSRIEACLPPGTRATIEGPAPAAPGRRRSPGAGDSRTARFVLDGTALEIVFAVTPRTAALEFHAYDIAAREAWRAAQAEGWRRARERAGNRD